MKSSCVTIGTFDGVHLGHQYLIRRLLEISKKNGLRSVLVTVSAPVRPVPGVLTTEREKIDLLKNYPLDEIIILPNTGEVLNQSALYFFEDFLCGKLGAKYIVAGENFAFGRDRVGNIQWLKEKAKARSIKIEIVKPFKSKGLVSSTRVRDLLIGDGLNEANKLLGRFYGFEGLPVKGRGLGRKLGFPTINLKVDDEKLLPTGIYAALTGLKKNNSAVWPSIINIGTRPTFFNKGNVHSEVHLLDVKCSWPGKPTVVSLCKFLRPEKKFKDIKKLTEQIRSDVSEAKEFFEI